MKLSLETLQRLQLLRAEGPQAALAGALYEHADEILADLVTLHECAAKLQPWDGREKRAQPECDVWLQLELACLETLIKRDHPNAGPQLRALARARELLGSSVAHAHDPRDPEVEEAPQSSAERGVGGGA